MFSELYLSERSREFVNTYQDEFNRRLTKWLFDSKLLTSEDIKVEYFEGKKYRHKEIIPTSDLSWIFGRGEQTIRKRIKEGLLEGVVFWYRNGFWLSPFAASVLYAPQRESYHHDSHIPSGEVLNELLLSPEKDPGLVGLVTKGCSRVYAKSFFHCYDMLHQRWALAMEDDEQRAKLMNGHDKSNGKIKTERRRPSPEQDEIERLVKSHTNFMYSTIHKMGIHEADRKGNMNPKWDIAVSAGMYGLFEAARRYDPSKDNQFIAYAVYWIRSLIFKDLLANHSLVKIGTTQGQRRLFYGLPKWLRGEIKELPADASSEDAAEYFKVSVETVKMMRGRLANGRDISLDAQLFDGNDNKSLYGEIPSQGPTPEEAITSPARFVKELFDEVIDVLDERERYIIERHRRVDDEDKETLKDIGKYLGITRERVRQLEVGALEKLKKAIVGKYPEVEEEFSP